MKTTVKYCHTDKLFYVRDTKGNLIETFKTRPDKGQVSQAVEMKAIREGLKKCGAWERMEKMQVYEVNEFILEMSDILSEDLKELLRRNVNRVQFYLDEQILEPG